MKWDISKLLILAVGVSSCVKVTNVTRHEVENEVIAEPRDPGPYRPKNIRRVAFMPFQNTAMLAHHTLEVDVAFANEKIAAGMADFQRNTGFATLDPNETQALLSERNLTGEYAQMLRDYLVSGLIDVQVVRKIASALRADVIVQGLLVSYGFEPLTIHAEGLTRSLDPKNWRYLSNATARWFVFEASSGRIEWNVTTMVRQEWTVRFSREENKTLAHIGLGVTTAIALAGVGLITVAAVKGSDSFPILLGVGGGMFVPVSFSPLFYTTGSESSQEIPPRKPLITMEQALAQMVQEALRRVALQFRPTE